MTMPPIKLSDDELDAIMAAAQPLQPHQRASFVEAVAAELAGLGEIGPGSLHRAIRTVWSSYFDPPLQGSDYAKYR